jgi:phosphoribosylpyrophosphate synthetase
VHGVFSADALSLLQGSGIDRLVTTNTIPNVTNAIDVSPLVAVGMGKVAEPGDRSHRKK